MTDVYMLYRLSDYNNRLYAMVFATRAAAQAFADSKAWAPGTYSIEAFGIVDEAWVKENVGRYAW